MCTPSPSRRDGFTVTEAVVALFLIAIGLLTLEGGAIMTLRTLRDSEHESLATQLVQTRAARLLAATCDASSGVDSAGMVSVAWSATVASGMLHVDQTARYPTAFGPHTESYHTVEPCP